MCILSAFGCPSYSLKCSALVSLAQQCNKCHSILLQERSAGAPSAWGAQQAFAGDPLKQEYAEGHCVQGDWFKQSMPGTGQGCNGTQKDEGSLALCLCLFQDLVAKLLQQQ